MTFLKKPVKKIVPEVIDETLDENQTKPVEYETEKPIIIRLRDHLFELYDFRYNDTRQTLEFKEKEATQYEDLEQRHLNSIWIDFQLDTNFHKKDKPSVILLEKILHSKFVDRYKPIVQYFQSLKWDGKDHIKQLSETVTVTDVDLEKGSTRTMWPPMLRRFLIACVACGLEIKENQVMLLLIGGQGTYKTTWLNRLAPPDLYNYSFTGHIEPVLTNNNTANILAEKFIVNLDDQLQTVFGKDFNLIKGIISATSITNRKAFRRDDKKRARIANFLGSVNVDHLFEDDENRRYLTFKIEKIDIAAKVDINQVWAQAYHIFKTNERYWFDSNEVAVINEMNLFFALGTPEEEWLVKLFRPVQTNDPFAKYYMANEIITILQKASGVRLSLRKLNTAMKKLKWKNRVSKRLPGNEDPRWCYAVEELFVQDSFGNIKIKE